MSKVELITKSQVIAVVQISRVESVEVAGAEEIYRQAASAKVERVLKGDIPRDVTLYGLRTTEASVEFAPGRWLVFLSRDQDLLVGTNWHLSMRPIRKDTVEWYVSNKGYRLKTVRLAAVLNEIEAILNHSRPGGFKDTPNNGMHPTADTTILKLSERFGAAGDAGR